MVIWLLKIFLCVVVREYQNDNILWEYENSRYSSEYDLHIDRKFHFMSLKYGVIGISYHYTLDVYNQFRPSEKLGTDDMGIFRVSLLHFGYIQDSWPLGWRSDEGLHARVRELD